MRDLHDKINPKRAFSPAAAVGDNTVYVTQTLDMQNLSAAELVILTGSLADADATFTTTAIESDTGVFGGEETNVDAGDLLGTLALASFTFAADDSVFKLGFRPNAHRYKRVKITPANNGGNAFIAAVWLTVPNIAPTSNPPN